MRKREPKNKRFILSPFVSYGRVKILGGRKCLCPQLSKHGQLCQHQCHDSVSLSHVHHCVATVTSYRDVLNCETSLYQVSKLLRNFDFIQNQIIKFNNKLHSTIRFIGTEPRLDLFEKTVFHRILCLIFFVDLDCLTI